MSLRTPYFLNFPQALQSLDLVLRIKRLSQRLQAPWLVWLVVASSLEAGSAFVPWLSWLIWPLWVWGLAQARQAQRLVWSGLPLVFLRQWGPLLRRPGVLYTLLLYGVLNFLIFSAFSESSHLLPSVAILLPGAAGILFPYTFAQSTAFLVTAACAERLVSTQDDVLKVLAYSVRDLLTSPFSWLVLTLIYSIPITQLATQAGLLAAQPAVATWMGHGLLAFLTLLWALGADHGTVTNHS
jgi:hypothetical protein